MGWKYFKLSKLLSDLWDAETKAHRNALEQIGEIVDTQIPLDEGTLLRSKYIYVDGTSGFISYGGGQGTGYPKVPYAVRWHEESANFQRGRKNNYLADPINQQGTKIYLREMKSELRKVFK